MKILNDIAKTNSVVAPVDMDSRVQKMVEATQVRVRDTSSNYL